MKKLIASIIAIIAINASAYDVTNTVTIVTNIYRRIGEKHYITNTTINLDVSQQAIDAARAQANRAASFADDALDHAEEAAASATTAQSHAADAKDYRDEAEYYAEQAHGQVQPIIDEGNRQIAAVQSAGNTQVSRVQAQGTYESEYVGRVGVQNANTVAAAGSTALNNINAKQQWFEQHFGQMVTNLDISVTTNIYVSEDQVARAGVAQNASNISALSTRIGTVEGSIGSLGFRIDNAEDKIENITNAIIKAKIEVNEKSRNAEKSTSKSIIHVLPGGWKSNWKCYANGVVDSSGIISSNNKVLLNAGQQYQTPGRFFIRIRCLSNKITVYQTGYDGFLFITTVESEYGASIRIEDEFQSVERTLYRKATYGVDGISLDAHLLESQKSTDRPAGVLSYSFQTSGYTFKYEIEQPSDADDVDYYISSDLNIRNGNDNSVMDRLVTTNEVMNLIRYFISEIK